jgi:F420-dependent methylenetetrahydromethanopterin dehydrogenase
MNNEERDQEIEKIKTDSINEIEKIKSEKDKEIETLKFENQNYAKTIEKLTEERIQLSKYKQM